MPRIIETSAPEMTDFQRAEIELWEAFLEGMSRSHKGNAWRRYLGLTVSVFCRPEGVYGWCIAGRGQTRFSRYTFATEELALSALYDAVLAEYNEK